MACRMCRNRSFLYFQGYRQTHCRYRSHCYKWTRGWRSSKGYEKTPSTTIRWTSKPLDHIQSWSIFWQFYCLVCYSSVDWWVQGSWSIRQFLRGFFQILAIFHDGGDNLKIAFRLYRGPLLIIQFLFLIGVNVYGWRSSGVNHVLIFELDPRNHLSEQHLMELAAVLGVVWTLSLLSFLFSASLSIPPYVNPLALVILMLAFLFNPLRVFRHEARFWLLRIMVTFLSFILSISTKFMLDFFLFLVESDNRTICLRKFCRFLAGWSTEQPGSSHFRFSFSYLFLCLQWKLAWGQWYVPVYNRFNGH